MKVKFYFKTSGYQFNLDDTTCHFLFSYILIFTVKNKLFSKEFVEIDSRIFPDLHEAIKNALVDILKANCEPIDIKQLQSYPSRFERINFQGTVYTVNYRVSLSGRLSYFVYTLLVFIEEAQQRGDILLLVWY